MSVRHPGRVLLTDILAARARRGSAPLLTHYDLGSGGGRTELSAASVANWVDKTANLLDTLGVEAGDTVALPVAHAHPGHWMAAIWVLASWRHGCPVLVAPAGAASRAAAVVVGPEAVRPWHGVPTIACSLHPLALPLRGLPDGVEDYGSLALAEPDACLPAALSPATVAWTDGDATRTHAEVAAVQAEAGRVLVRPTTPWETFAAAVAGPLLGGGSAVVVAGTDDSRLAAIATQEQVSP